MDGYGDGYMEPEEEWEREGLLDPAWEKQQKKVSVTFDDALLLLRVIISSTWSDATTTATSASDRKTVCDYFWFFKSILD